MPVRFTQNNLDLNQNDYLYQICPLFGNIYF